MPATPSPVSSPRIYQLTPRDLGRFRQLMACFAEAFEEPDTYVGRPPSDDYAARLLAAHEFVALVALGADDAVIGGLTAYELRKPEQERSEIYIYDLAVSEMHRRRGIATALINHLGSIASARGAYVIFVQADHTDPPAIALYTKLGRREDVLHFDIEPS
ncbi:MAG: AAC(3)-I family aminoglycoside N-acetyltransferase [Hyphomicrobiaceae bacterium]